MLSVFFMPGCRHHPAFQMADLPNARWCWPGQSHRLLLISGRIGDFWTPGDITPRDRRNRYAVEFVSAPLPGVCGPRTAGP